MKLLRSRGGTWRRGRGPPPGIPDTGSGEIQGLLGIVV